MTVEELEFLALLGANCFAVSTWVAVYINRINYRIREYEAAKSWRKSTLRWYLRDIEDPWWRETYVDADFRFPPGKAKDEMEEARIMPEWLFWCILTLALLLGPLRR